jgi:hypothetical protein
LPDDGDLTLDRTVANVIDLDEMFAAKFAHIHFYRLLHGARI